MVAPLELAAFHWAANAHCSAPPPPNCIPAQQVRSLFALFCAFCLLFRLSCCLFLRGALRLQSFGTFRGGWSLGTESERRRRRRSGGREKRISPFERERDKGAHFCVRLECAGGMLMCSMSWSFVLTWAQPAGPKGSSSLGLAEGRSPSCLFLARSIGTPNANERYGIRGPTCEHCLFASNHPATKQRAVLLASVAPRLATGRLFRQRVNVRP